MDFLGVFLFCSAMFMLICLAVAVRGQILYHNEIYTCQQQTIADMKEKLDTVERERDTLKCELERANQTIADMMGDMSIARNERHGVVEELEKVAKERDAFKCDFERVNKSHGDLMTKHYAVVSERNDAVAKLEKGERELDELREQINQVSSFGISEVERITKERDELQAKVCELKTNDIELLNLKIYKERVLTRLKSIIDDEVDE